MKKPQDKPKMVEVRTDSVHALADNIASIAKTTKAITADGGLTMDAIVTLLHRKTGVSRTEIEAVLSGMRTLDTFVKMKAPK